MKLLATIFYALGTLFFYFYTVWAFAQPERYPFHEVIEAALFAALFTVWFIDRLKPLSDRLKFTLGAVAFTFAAVMPTYTLWTAVFGAIALAEIVAAYLAWKAHAEDVQERELLARLITAYEEAPSEFKGLDIDALKDRRDSLK